MLRQLDFLMVKDTSSRYPTDRTESKREKGGVLGGSAQVVIAANSKSLIFNIARFKIPFPPLDPFGP